MIRHGGDLRQVRDAENLVALPDSGHLFRNSLRCPSADSRINFIENQSLRLVPVGKNALYRQHNPGELSAGNHLAERLQRLARIRGNPEFYGIVPVPAVTRRPGKRDFKIRGQKVQLLQPLPDLRSKAPGTFLSFFRKFFAAFFQLFLRLAQFLCQSCFLCLEIFQLLQLFLLPVQILSDFFQSTAVLGLQTVHLVQPGFRLIKILLGEREILQISGGLTVKIIQEVVDVPQRPRQFFQLTVEIRDSIKLRYRLSDGVPGSLFITGQPVYFSKRLRDFFPVCHFAVRLLQLLILTRLKRSILNFLYLILKKRAFPLSLALINLVVLQRLLYAAVVLPEQSRFLQKSGKAVLSVGIQNFQLAVRVKKRLMLMLPVNIQQQGRNPSDSCRRGRFSVQAEDTAAVLYFPGDDQQSVLGFHIHFPETFQHCRVFHGKDQFYQSRLRVITEHFPGHLLAQGEVYRAQKHGLSCPCFSGQNVQAGSEGNLRLFYQPDIFHMQLCKHLFPPQHFFQSVHDTDGLVPAPDRAHDGVIPRNAAHNLADVHFVQRGGGSHCHA